MSDAREALVALILERFRAAETYMDLPRQARLLADAILAAGWTPPGERVKPSIEDVARRVDEALRPYQVDPSQGPSDAAQDVTRAVLALLPGRSEAEVRQDEAERIAAWVTADEPSDTLVLLADALRRGDHRG